MWEDLESWLLSGPIREGFREEVMSELGLEASVGFRTAAVGISGVARRGKEQYGRLRPEQADSRTEQGSGMW